jgi:hypothetical protein
MNRSWLLVFFRRVVGKLHALSAVVRSRGSKMRQGGCPAML